MKTFTFHKCSKVHETYRRLVKCMLPRAQWVSSEGEYAVIAWCARPTVTLHAHLAAAEAGLKFINNPQCGTDCTQNHEIVQIQLDAEPRTQEATE